MEEQEDKSTIVNWSATHECHPQAYHQPESLEELETLVAKAHKKGTKLRPIGSALSPNGVGFSDEELVNLAMLDQVVNVDAERGLVTVQAGARVSQVTDALRPHGLVLQNFASIAEQQLGGFTQVGAHGTGATLPPVDERVVGLKIVTPGRGTLQLSAESNPELFNLAKVAMGCLGVVAEVTIKCVPAHKLVERTYVVSRSFIKENHERLLRENKHIRYMWIPYTQDVIVVACNPLGADEDEEAVVKSVPHVCVCELKKCEPMQKLLLEVSPEYQGWFNRRRAELLLMNFAELRDKLLAHNPLDAAWVRRVNQAEAAFWRNNAGVRVDYSDRILGFECGGEQWVSEVAFPCGSLENLSMKDITYMEEVLELIEAENIAAPSPIEQRWTAGSSSRMSPASASPNDASSLHSWIGIIMYLPSQEPAVRAQITAAFNAYKELCIERLWGKYGAVEHWAKVELPDSSEKLEDLRRRLRERFPVDAFNAARRKLDPKNILSNDLIDGIFPQGALSPLEWLSCKVPLLSSKLPLK